MDTKWKNTVKKTAGLAKRYLWKYRRLLLGALAILVGVFVFLQTISFGYDTNRTWFFGAWVNLFIAAGIVCILPELLRKLYGSWLPTNAGFYEEWKKKLKKQQQISLAVLALLLVLCFAFWSWQKTGLFYQSWNYARGYLTFATVIIQWILCEGLLLFFMLGRLNMLMDCMTQINRESLQNALEIEKRSMEKVSRSDQLRVDLITNVSHDLKTPLTSMVGYIELLKKEDLNDTARDYVEVISGRATKLKEMIESLFSLAKASSGNVELHMETIELNRLMEQIFADMDDRMKASGLEFVTFFTDEDTHMASDNAYMYRICQNLLENALKYAAKNTRVFVRTSVEADGRLCLEITNTAGYRMDFSKEDIVERFARADKARASEGNGLGLAIVSSYTKALGGDFDILLDCDQFKARLLFPRDRA